MMDDEICKSISSADWWLTVDDLWWFHPMVTALKFIVFIFFPLVHGSSLSLVSSTSSIYSTVSITKWNVYFFIKIIELAGLAVLILPFKEQEKSSFHLTVFWMLARKGRFVFLKMFMFEDACGYLAH